MSVTTQQKAEINVEDSIEKRIKQMIMSCGADVCGISSIKRFEAAPQGFSPKDIWGGCNPVQNGLSSWELNKGIKFRFFRINI